MPTPDVAAGAGPAPATPGWQRQPLSAAVVADGATNDRLQVALLEPLERGQLCRQPRTYGAEEMNAGVR
jgi:hypothetical protein